MLWHNIVYCNNGIIIIIKCVVYCYIQFLGRDSSWMCVGFFMFHQYLLSMSALAVLGESSRIFAMFGWPRCLEVVPASSAQDVLCFGLGRTVRRTWARLKQRKVEREKTCPRARPRSADGGQSNGLSWNQQLMVSRDGMWDSKPRPQRRIVIWI